jgi:aryl-alcohol dehydrogenase-like predicted oxidoreductase
MATIPGISSIAHVEETVATAAVRLSLEQVAG